MVTTRRDRLLQRLVERNRADAVAEERVEWRPVLHRHRDCRRAQRHNASLPEPERSRKCLLGLSR